MWASVLLSAGWLQNMAFLVKWTTGPMVYVLWFRVISKTINKFSNDIIQYAPPASQIKSVEIIPKPVNGYNNFTISKSKPVDAEITEISPDIAVCPDCLQDLETDPERIDYPFINCTNCGPRFTIIEDTSLRPAFNHNEEFPDVQHCQSEYNDILDRRFHAQPIACNSCGPELHLPGL